MKKLMTPAKSNTGAPEMSWAVCPASPGVIRGTNAPKLPKPPSTAITASEMPATIAAVRGDHDVKLNGRCDTSG